MLIEAPYKVGDTVKVSFNVSTNEHNGKYYTSLNAWSIFKESSSENTPAKKESIKEMKKKISLMKV